ARRQPLVPEHHFHSLNDLSPRPLRPLPDVPAVAGGSALPRLRQMFQVGLLAILRQQNEAMNLQLLARASLRFAAQLPAASGDGTCHLSADVSAALAAGELGLKLTRRSSVGGVERRMARAIKSARQGEPLAVDEELRRDLLFLLAITEVCEGRLAE